MSSNALIQAAEKSQIKSDLPTLAVGDTVDVHVKIVEGDKTRTQVFNGVIIKIQGVGLNKRITVRRIVANEGVERQFPVHSPRVDKIEVKRHGDVRRAKLYYLRERVGKSRRLRDRRRGLEAVVGEAAPESSAGGGDAHASQAKSDTPKADKPKREKAKA